MIREETHPPQIIQKRERQKVKKKREKKGNGWMTLDGGMKM